jgi:hypothetical protein
MKLCRFFSFRFSGRHDFSRATWKPEMARGYAAFGLSPEICVLAGDMERPIGKGFSRPAENNVLRRYVAFGRQERQPYLTARKYKPLGGGLYKQRRTAYV